MSTTALVAGLLQGNGAFASVTQDIESKMTRMLGHTPTVINIKDADAQRLSRGSSEFQPWSGSYWPDITGGIASHYRDHTTFGSQVNFVMRYGIAKARLNQDHRQVAKKVNVWDDEKRNEKMSPAEKYDLLLGDLDFTFTQAVMEEADFRSKYRLTTKRSETGEDQEAEGDDVSYYEDHQSTYSRFDDTILYRYWRQKSGSLAYWSGICDGWSPASIYLPRPVKAITVTGALGHRITFYPDDLKALGSYLFARTNTPYFATMNYQMAGRKCDESGTPNRKDNGMVEDIRCNDLDAGVWHLSLLNRIGKDRMGFVMDIDNNLKINNHPISSYELVYYNPMTGDEGSLSQSIVDAKSVQDAYASRRNPKTRYLVGVKSKIFYMNYIWAEDNRKDSTDHHSKDKIKDKSFVYDLELDENFNILGGEWGSRSNENGTKVKYDDQPDFIWMTAPGALPYSEMSSYAVPGTIKDSSNPRPFGNMNWAWDGKSSLPSDWLSAAKADLTWSSPVPGFKTESEDGSVDISPAESKNSVLKSAQPLSHIVYYLFDQARMSTQK